MKVGYRFLVADRLDHAFDSYLPRQIRPVKHQSGTRIFGELVSLARIVIGEECESFFAVLLQQHHSCRDVAASAGSRQSHCGRVVPRSWRQLLGRAEPQRKLAEGIHDLFGHHRNGFDFDHQFGDH